MKALDLFCGGGGSSKGLENAGFSQIVGVDQKRFKEYPYELLKKDVFELAYDFFAEFDFVWASPPCQAYSVGTKGWRNKGKKYPALIPKTQKMLRTVDKPFIIENVPGSSPPLRRDLMLCGDMFDLRLIRHRIFEVSGFYCSQPPHKPHKVHLWDGSAVPVYMRGISKTHSWEYAPDKRCYYVCVVGHGGDGGKGNCSLEAWQEAMEIDWITNKKTLAQCVPPKYAEYIGRQFLERKQQLLTPYLLEVEG